MKKALSILLSILLICGAVSAALITASAEEKDVSLIKSEEFVNALNAYVKATGLGKLFSAMTGKTGEYTFTTETVKTDNFINIIKSDSETEIFAFDTLEPYEASEIIDGYSFINPSFLAPTEMSDKLGICVYKDGKIFTLREAVEHELYTAEKLVENISGADYEQREASVLDTKEFMDIINEYVKASGLDGSIILKKEVRPGSISYRFTSENTMTYLNIFIADCEEAVFSFGKANPDGASEIIGSYRFINQQFSSPAETDNRTGICVYKDAKVYTLREAIEKNVYTVEELAKIIPNTVKVEELTATQPATAAPKTQSVIEGSDIAPKREVKKANSMKITAKTKIVKAKKLKKSKVTVTAITVKNAKGKVAYKKLSGSKKLTITKKGKITVKKGTKKGTYRIKVKITAKGNSQYLEKSVTKTVKVRVK